MSQWRLSSSGPQQAKHSLPSGRAAPKQIGERCGRISEKHDAKARRDQVETVGLELMGLRVCLDQRDVAEPGFSEALARLRQHRTGDVGAQDLTALADGLGERHGEGAGAAADLERPLAARHPRARQEQIVNRPHPPLDETLEPDPARASDRIPIFLLRRIRYGVHC